MDFADVIKLKQTSGESILDYLSGPNAITRVLTEAVESKSWEKIGLWKQKGQS
jgi:hypothetical protein